MERSFYFLRHCYKYEVFLRFKESCTPFWSSLCVLELCQKQQATQKRIVRGPYFYDLNKQHSRMSKRIESSSFFRLLFFSRDMSEKKRKRRSFFPCFQCLHNSSTRLELDHRRPKILDRNEVKNKAFDTTSLSGSFLITCLNSTPNFRVLQLLK